MKKIITLALGLLVLAGSAEAATGLLQITGWLTSATQASVSVYDPIMGNHTGTYGVGAFTWKFNAIQQNSPLYCLDVFHSFTWNNSWLVDVIPVPPDPNPPHNTDQAAWIYYNYGASNLTGVRAQGVQLALWEVSHEQDWMDHYTASTWWQLGDQESGDFAINSVSSAARDEATMILADLYGTTNPEQYSAYYYKPVTADTGQGQLGQIPEPGVLILLGTGLVSAAGATWRRKRKLS